MQCLPDRSVRIDHSDFPNIHTLYGAVLKCHVTLPRDPWWISHTNPIRYHGNWITNGMCVLRDFCCVIHFAPNKVNPSLIRPSTGGINKINVTRPVAMVTKVHVVYSYRKIFIEFRCDLLCYESSIRFCLLTCTLGTGWCAQYKIPRTVLEIPPHWDALPKVILV